MELEIEWKLFADLAEHAGSRTISLSVDTDATVEDALDALFQSNGDLEAHVIDGSTIRSDINVLRNGSDVNAAEAGLGTRIEDGDELALFPPVSGG